MHKSPKRSRTLRLDEDVSTPLTSCALFRLPGRSLGIGGLGLPVGNLWIGLPGLGLLPCLRSRRLSLLRLGLLGRRLLDPVQRFAAEIAEYRSLRDLLAAFGTEHSSFLLSW